MVVQGQGSCVAHVAPACGKFLLGISRIIKPDSDTFSNYLLFILRSLLAHGAFAFSKFYYKNDIFGLGAP